MRRIAAVALALALVSAACGDDEAVPTTTEVSPSSTAVSTTIAPVGPVGAVEDDIADLIAIAQEVRGLQFLDPPTVTFLTDEDLEARIRSDLAEEVDPAEVAIEEALYELLGLIDPDLDLLAAFTDLYAEQVAGFYDFDTRELVVSGSADATPLTKTIVVHELIHALADQHFAFGAALDELFTAERYEQAQAYQAMIEGEATYFQIVYLQSLPFEEQFDAARESALSDTTVLDTLPAFIGADLAFPYDTGFRFIERIVTDQGIEGVDQAFRLPPTTTEQVLRPNAYFTLEPAIEVELSASLSGWDEGFSGVFGQWNLSNMLLRGVDGGTATIAADGWGGDAFSFLVNGEDSALVLHYVGDTPRDARELFDAWVAGLPTTLGVRTPTTTAPGPDDDPAVVPSTASFTGRVTASLEMLGADVVLVVSTDAAAVAELAEANGLS